MAAAVSQIRRLTTDDLPFLWLMLREAAYWRLPASTRPSVEQIAADRHVARYLDEWGREGDDGVVALAHDGPVGAAWFRLFKPAEAGYGFVNPRIPEMSLAVVAQWRRRGVGGALLAASLELADELGHESLSLSVEADNPARRLYEKAGFVKVGTVSGSWTMVADVRGGRRRT